MATLATGKTWVSGDEVTPAELNNMVNNATISGIINADIASAAGIAGSKLADGGVSAAKLASTLDLTGKTVTLPPASVNAAALATDAVETAKIKDGSVSAGKLSGAQTGSAPIYGCRAWVNFDGTRDSSGAASTANTARFIRASGNVASVVRNDTGIYAVTLTTPMVDANYAVTFGGRRSQDVGNTEASPQLSFSTATTSSFLVGCQDNDNNIYRDATDVCVAVFR